MSYPIVELIAQAIKARVETMTADNGYLTDIVECVRPLKAGLQVGHRSVVLEQGRRQPIESRPDSLASYNQPFLLKLVWVPSDETQIPIDTAINCFAADVEKAFAGSETWMVSGVINYEIDGPSALPEGADYDGCMMTLTVHYRHKYGDPFTP